MKILRFYLQLFHCFEPLCSVRFVAFSPQITSEISFRDPTKLNNYLIKRSDGTVLFLQEEIVKLQILNLAVKLFLTNAEQTKLLCQYVLTLARYDQNYDIRDRSRLLRQILFPQNEKSKINEKAREIFLANKPAPLLVSNFIGTYFLTI